MGNKIIYLASPYTHPERMVREIRFHKVTEYTAKLVAEGNIVFSPISYGHLLSEFHNMPTDFEFWENFCLTFLSKCDEMYILKLEGWEESEGIDQEEQFCNFNNKPVKYIDYEKK